VAQLVERAMKAPMKVHSLTPVIGNLIMNMFTNCKIISEKY